MRKWLLVTCAGLALATAPVLSADARDGGGKHWRGGHHQGWHGHRGHGGWRGPGITLRLGAPYYAYGSCQQTQRVWTPRGWRWRAVWVC